MKGRTPVLILALAAFAVASAWPRAASAQSCQANCVLVNDAGDTINPSCSPSGIGTCSLRDAITQVGYLNGFVIQFAVGSGPHRINLMSNLPGICGSGDIDGRTQPGFAGVPLIEIHQPAGSGAWHGLLIGDPPLPCQAGVTVRSLVINHFGNFGCADCGGIIMENPGGNFVLGCYIGTDASGMAADGNDVGILDDTFGGNYYGGITAADRNVIAGNGAEIHITNTRGGYAAQDVIQGNYIGTDATGTGVLGTTIGIAAGPPFPGFAPGILIGGPPGSGAGNLIAGLGGIRLGSGGGNVVQGNYIGLDKTGLVSLPMENAIELDGETNATIADNVISASGYGIGFFADAAGTKTHGTTVQGNYIGTDATGNRILVTGASGLSFAGGQNNTIGGAGAGQGNVIGGFLHGIDVTALPDTGNVIQGNRIGIGVDGSPIPNVQAGIAAWGSSGGTVIGGTDIGEENVIAYNGLGVPGSHAPGVWVLNGSGNVILGNSMFQNTGKGIDFYYPASPLPYPNDVGDGDTGGNNLQNFPLITGVTIAPDSVRVQGTLNTMPFHTFLFEFYADPVPVHPSDFLQGKAFLGVAGPPITADFQGNLSFDVTIPVTTVPNFWVTATATDVDGCPLAPQQNVYCGSTSEFSQRSLFSVTPNHGPAVGGTNTTLKGQLFQPLAVERFGSIVTTNTGFIDDHTITAVTPPMPAGTLLDVSITNPDGSVALMQKAFMVEFNDVPSSDAFYGYVMSLAGDGVTGGCGGGNYCPDNDVTRAQMAVFLLKARYGPWWMPPSPTGTLFGDVASDSFAAGWIEELYNEGITGGCSASPLLYCPGNPVRRQQMAVFLLKAEHGSSYVPPPCGGIFGDVACPSLFADWIERLYDEGVTGGCGGGNYCPTNNVTRGQMAVFITKAFNLP